MLQEPLGREIAVQKPEVPWAAVELPGAALKQGCVGHSIRKRVTIGGVRLKSKSCDMSVSIGLEAFCGPNEVFSLSGLG